MKTFWVILLVLVMGAVAYLAIGRSAAPKSVSDLARFADTPTDLSRPANDESAFFSGDDSKPVGAAPVKPAVESKPALAAPEIPKVEAPKAKIEPKPDATIPPPPPVEKKPDPKAEEKPAPPAPAETKKEIPAPAPVKETPKPMPDVPAPSALPPSQPPPAPTKPAEKQAEATGASAVKMVKQDDGSMLVDDKYPLKGEGTREKPYEITWEYLVSAQEEYQPRLGKKKLPGRFTLLSGKRVKITGNVAFPVAAEEPTEMLVMLNQWDGCCIGVPPTPYDAVEVKLKSAASTDQRLTTYGAVEGKLTVEPYLVRDWLVSLYSMDDATMTKAQ